MCLILSCFCVGLNRGSWWREIQSVVKNTFNVYSVSTIHSAFNLKSLIIEYFSVILTKRSEMLATNWSSLNSITVGVSMFEKLRPNWSKFHIDIQMLLCSGYLLKSNQTFFYVVYTLTTSRWTLWISMSWPNDIKSCTRQLLYIWDTVACWRCLPTQKHACSKRFWSVDRGTCEYSFNCCTLF